MLNLPLSHIVAELHVDGQTYDVEHFHIGFEQSVDYKGQPQHETTGGQLYITLTQCADDMLYEWSKKSTLRKSGSVAFVTEMAGTVLDMQFEDAYCVKLSLEIDAYAGTKTTLCLSPKTVVMNGVTHENHWSN